VLNGHGARWSLRMLVLAVGCCALLACTTATHVQIDAPRASTDPQLIERGRYLAYGPAHCAFCHGDPALEEDLLRGADIPLSGGRRFDLGMLGSVVGPNITSDPIAGIGAFSDAALVRALRYGISHTGRPLVPFMPFAELTDRDLQAIVSFLRTTAPIRKASPPNDLSWLGAFAVNVVLDAQSPSVPPRGEIQPQRTAEYGRYLAHTVANCHGCHTQRSKLSGEFVGHPFAGGLKMTEASGTFVTPNLTPVADGVMQSFDEHEFIEYFRSRARVPTRSPMPWVAFARMTDDDLGAIYRYLKMLPPAS
jgi:mono/diheme cytochrome c family protein